MTCCLSCACALCVVTKKAWADVRATQAPWSIIAFKRERFCFVSFRPSIVISQQGRLSHQVGPLRKHGRAGSDVAETRCDNGAVLCSSAMRGARVGPSCACINECSGVQNRAGQDTTRWVRGLLAFWLHLGNLESILFCLSGVASCPSG